MILFLLTIIKNCRYSQHLGGKCRSHTVQSFVLLLGWRGSSFQPQLDRNVMS